MIEVLIQMQVYHFRYAGGGGSENDTLIACVTGFSGQVFLVQTNLNCDTCQLLLSLSYTVDPLLSCRKPHFPAKKPHSTHKWKHPVKTKP